MTWIKFITCLTILYAAYYGVMILIDITRAGKKPVGETSSELTFVHDEDPVRIVPGDDNDDPIIFSGGQTLQQIFSLAREEVIEYTRPVSFGS